MRVEKTKHLPIDSIDHSHKSEGIITKEVMHNNLIQIELAFQLHA